MATYDLGLDFRCEARPHAVQEPVNSILATFRNEGCLPLPDRRSTIEASTLEVSARHRDVRKVYCPGRVP
mgnify:FL=1